MKVQDLFEAEDERLPGKHSTDDPKAFFEEVGQRCGPYLQEAGKMWGSAYRGVGIARFNFIEKQARLEGRSPLSSSVELHNGINEIFKAKYGYPFRNGVFATSSWDMVEDYGQNVFTIFPIGNFKYLWSPEIHDLFDSLSIKYWTEQRAKPEGTKSDSGAEKTQKMLAIVDSIEFRTDGLQEAIASENEIMFWCSGYLGARHDYLTASDIELEMQTFPQFYKRLQARQ